MKSFIAVLLLLSLAAGAVMFGACAQELAFRGGIAREFEDSGFDHFYNLEYDSAIEDYRKMLEADPQSAAAHNHIAVSYFYKQLLAAGVLEGDLYSSSNRFFRIKGLQTDPALLKGFKDHNAEAIRICESRLKTNSRDMEPLYDCGVAYANRAAYLGLIDRARIDAISSARKADDYHERLTILDPRRYDAFLVPGIFDYMLGSLPRSLRFFLFFGGLAGDKEKGLQMVESAAANGDRSKYDAAIMLALLYRREKRYDDARKTIEELARKFPRNYILPLETASLYRLSGDDSSPVRIYEQALLDIANGKPGYASAPSARIHFELGGIFAKTGEIEKARFHLEEAKRAQGTNERLVQEATALLTTLSAQASADRAPTPR